MPRDRQPGKYEWRIPFGKENETLNKENFGTSFLNFLNASYAKRAPKEKDETELHYTKRVTETSTAAKLCADTVIHKIVGMLTHEQKMQIYQDAPDKEYIPRSVRGKFSRILTGADSDYQKKVNLSKIEGPDQTKYIAEVKKLDDAGRILNNHISIEEAKEAVKDLLTPEQIAEVADPANNITPKFIIDNREYVQGKLAEMLTPEQMKELKVTADNYIVPWERTPEEMGEKVYTAESDKAKADIDAREDLSQEQKDEMKADIDAANDFLRRPNDIDDPSASYHALSASNSGYDNAILKDEKERSKAQAEKEGLDLDAVEETIEPKTFNIIVVQKKGKEKEYQQWQNTDYKFAPETREAIKHVYSKMLEYGYLGKGIVLEQGAKEYGLSKLARSIEAYTDAIKSGDAQKIAETSKAMMTEQAHVDELIEYVRENFPVDPKSENFARAGNVDVVRNKAFPPKYRLDEAVPAFNSIYILGNFLEANGWNIDEFLDSPMKHAKEYFFETTNQGLNKSLKGKTGGAALFEASRDIKMVVALGFGAGRPFETLTYVDKDPAIRAHNHAVESYLDKAVINNGDMSDVQRRNVAYTQGHLDRFLYVTEPRDNASLLGVPIYNPKTLGYDQPEPFDEASYLQNNGKSVGEMKELLDNNIKEFLYLSKTQLYTDNIGNLLEQPAYASDRLVEIAQTAASKILIAKHAQKDDPAYQALKGILTNGQEYVNGLIQAEKDKVQEAEQQLELAKKDGNQQEIDRLTAYIDANKAYKDINVVVPEQKTKYAENLASYEKTVSEYEEKSPKIDNIKPDEEFNKSMLKLKEEINSRIAERVAEIDIQKVATDEIIQVLNITKDQKLSEAKQDYIKQLGEDVKSGRISEGYKREREKQLNDPKYQYDELPDLFPKSDDMTEEQKAERQRDIEKYVLKQNAEVLGFVTTVPEVKAEEKAVEAEKQEKKEQQAEFTGRWFKPGQEVSADVFLAKIKEVETLVASPIVGDNWLKNREEYEKRGREKVRLGVVFEEGLNTLTDEGKQNVFDSLDAESKQKAVGSANYQYAVRLSAKGKSEESKAFANELYSKGDEMTLEEVQKQAEKFLTDEEKADPALKPYNHIRSDYVLGKGPAVWESLIKNIPEDKLKSIALKADAKQTALERMTLDEAKITRYKKEFDSVKTMFGQMSFLDEKPLTNERKAEIMAKFDRVQDMMSGIDKEYINEIGRIRLNREQEKYGINNTRRTYALQGLKAQGFDVTPRGNMEMNWAGEKKEEFTTESGKETWEIVKPESQEEYQRLKEQKFEYRPETKKAIKDIFAKFDEYGLDDAPFHVEEGENKVYALHKYGKVHDEFAAKIQSDDPVDKLQAIGLADKMNQEYDRAKELIGMASKLYGVEDGGFFPGNMDLERTEGVPPEFRTDTKGTSALNGIYLVYRELKEQNYDYDKFLEDPRAFLNHQVEKHVKKDDINLTMKGKSGAEAMYEAFVPVQNGNIDLYETSRLAENLSEMEKDPALRTKNLASEYSHILSGQKVVSELSEVRNELWRVATKHIERFLLVKDPQQDASLLGVHTKDFNTRTIIPPKYFDEMEYLMNNPEDPKEFADRVMREGGKFMEMIAKDLPKKEKDRLSVSELQPIRGVRAMQRAAIKFLTAHPDIDKQSEAYMTLNTLATDAPNFIKNMLTEQVNKGQIDLNVNELKLDEIKKFSLKQSFEDFKKSDTIKFFGEIVRDKDEEVNRDLKSLQKDVARAQKAFNRRGGEAEKQQLKEAQESLANAVKERKNELLESFRAGKITEDYLNRRTAQLDGGKFGDKPPKMFEADQLMSQNDYLKDYAKQFNEKNPDADFNLNELSKEEKNELYDRYVENAKRSKEQFLANKYMQSEDLTSKIPQQTIAERIAAEDARLTRLGEAPIKGNTVTNKKVDEPQVKQDEPQVENIVVDLEEEPQIQNKAEQKVENKDEVKVEEKVVDNTSGTRIDVNLDEEVVEMNDDILNFDGKQKELGKEQQMKV